MNGVFICKVCKSKEVQIFHVPKGDGYTVFVWCQNCGSVNDGVMINENEKEPLKSSILKGGGNEKR